VSSVIANADQFKIQLIHTTQNSRRDVRFGVHLRNQHIQGLVIVAGDCCSTLREGQLPKIDLIDSIIIGPIRSYGHFAPSDIECITHSENNHAMKPTLLAICCHQIVIGSGCLMAHIL
jgi:hypothetical protein